MGDKMDKHSDMWLVIKIRNHIFQKLFLRSNFLVSLLIDDSR